MVYGLLFFINLPHGEVMMLGTFLALLFLLSGFHPALALVLAMLLTGVLGILVERFVYRRLRHARRLAPLLSALGLVLVFQNGVMLLVGPNEKAFPAVFGSTVLVLGDVRVPPTILVDDSGGPRAHGAAPSLLDENHHRHRHPRNIAGHGGRATRRHQREYDRDGHLRHRVGTRGGRRIPLGCRYGSAYANMGFPVMLKAFAACVLGGIGRIPGAVLGGLIIGISEVLVAAYLGELSARGGVRDPRGHSAHPTHRPPGGTDRDPSVRECNAD